MRFNLMNEGAVAKRAFYRASAVGAVIVIALVMVIELAMPDFPGTSPASMVFFAVLAFAAVASILAVLVRVFVKVSACMPVTWWMVALVISRVSFAWAMFALVAIAVIGSIIDRQLARPLFHTVIVEMLLGAFWLMATATVMILAVVWARPRNGGQARR